MIDEKPTTRIVDLCYHILEVLTELIYQDPVKIFEESFLLYADIIKNGNEFHLLAEKVLMQSIIKDDLRLMFTHQDWMNLLPKFHTETNDLIFLYNLTYHATNFSSDIRGFQFCSKILLKDDKYEDLSI